MNEDEDHQPSPGKADVAAARDGIGGNPSKDEGSAERKASSAAMNGADFQRYIGRGLRAVFDDVASQPVPDRFLDLMKKLG